MKTLDLCADLLVVAQWDTGHSCPITDPVEDLQEREDIVVTGCPLHSSQGIHNSACIDRSCMLSGEWFRVVIIWSSCGVSSSFLFAETSRQILRSRLSSSMSRTMLVWACGYWYIWFRSSVFFTCARLRACKSRHIQMRILHSQSMLFWPTWLCCLNGTQLISPSWFDAPNIHPAVHIKHLSSPYFCLSLIDWLPQIQEIAQARKLVVGRVLDVGVWLVHRWCNQNEKWKKRTRSMTLRSQLVSRGKRWSKAVRYTLSIHNLRLLKGGKWKCVRDHQPDPSFMVSSVVEVEQK